MKLEGMQEVYIHVAYAYNIRVMSFMLPALRPSAWILQVEFSGDRLDGRNATKGSVRLELRIQIARKDQPQARPIQNIQKFL